MTKRRKQQKAEQKARPLLSRLSPLFPAKESPAAAATAVGILTTELRRRTWRKGSWRRMKRRSVTTTTETAAITIIVVTINPKMKKKPSHPGTLPLSLIHPGGIPTAPQEVPARNQQCQQCQLNPRTP